MPEIMTSETRSDQRPQTPCGINHIVLAVRDIEASHRFYADLLGFVHVGSSSRPDPGGLPPTRFYSGRRDQKLHHHDLALEQQAEDWDHHGGSTLDHFAIEYPTLDAWTKQIEFLTANDIALSRRIKRGVTYSVHLRDPDSNIVELVFELPRSAWENDIEGALNREPVAL